MSKRQGFAGMTEEQRTAIARQGGKAVPAASRAFSQDPGLAARAGASGGRSVPPAKRSFARDPALAARAGKAGGEATPPENRSFTRDRRLAAAAGKAGGTARAVRVKAFKDALRLLVGLHTAEDAEIGFHTVSVDVPADPEAYVKAWQTVAQEAAR
jgi:general stress protein YciG